MSVSGPSTWPENRIERVLLWFLRIILFLLLIGSLLGGEFSQVLALVGILGVHGVAYWATPRIPSSLWRRWGITLTDIVLTGLAFYLGGDMAGQGVILGLCVVAIVAARLSLWQALTVNVGVWLLLSWTLIYSWLWQGDPFSPIVVGNLILSLALTLGVSYLVSMETHQARTVEDASLRLRQLSLVSEVGRTITSTLDMETVLELIMEKAVEILNAEAGSLLLLDQQSGESVFRVVLGPVSEALIGQRLAPGEGIVGAAIQTGEAQLVNDVQFDGRWHMESDLETGFETKSVLCAPMISRGHPVGALEVVNKLDGSAFGSNDLELLSNFAVQAAVAVENARLYESTDEALHKRVQELATIEEIDHELGATLGHDRIISLILDRAFEATKAKSGLLGILAPDGKRLDALFLQGEKPEVPSDLPAEGWPVERGIIGRVIRTGQSALLSDVDADPDYEGIIKGTRSEMAVPIKREARVIGVLNLESDQLAAFTREDLRFIEHLVDHAGIAIENARLFQEERLRVQTLSAVGEVSRDILSSPDLDRTLNLILTRIKSLMEYSSAEICLWDDTRQVVVTGSAAGDPRHIARVGGIYHLDEGYTGWIARHKQRLLIPDIAARPDVQPKVLAEDAPVRSYVGLPLTTSDAFVGTLELASDQPGAYTEADLEILQIFADQAAVAIQNARLHEETWRRLQEFSELLQISQAIGSLSECRQIHAQINEHIAYLMSVEVCGILLYEASEQALVSQPPFFGISDEAVSRYRVHVPEGSLAWHLWQERDHLLLNNVENEPLIDDLGLRSLAQASGLRDTLLAAMAVGQRRIGVIQVANKADGTRFTEDDARLLCIFASQAAAVVENARLFGTQQEQLREMSILFEMGAAVSSSLDLKEVLSSVARHVAYALDVSGCTISDWDPSKNVVTTLVAVTRTADDGVALSPDAVGGATSLVDYPAKTQVLCDRQPLAVTVADLGADPAERVLLEQRGHKSLLMMPLVTSDRVLGLLELYESHSVREFTANEIRLCRVLANQAAAAIDNARLYEETDERLRARIDELTALQRTMQELNATLELDHILQVVLGLAVQTSHATHGNVMLMDMDSGDLILRTTYGYSAEEAADIKELLLRPSEESISLQAVQSGQARIIDDATRESCIVCVRGDTRSALVVPVFYQDVVVGLINLLHKGIEAFDGDDLTFVQTLAGQAAIAIGNAMRFEEQVRVNRTLSQRSEQIDGLLAVSQKLRTDVRLEDALEEVAYAIQETVGFNVVLVSVIEDLQSATPVLRRVVAAGLPLDVFEEAKRVRQPPERYERILREEYQQGLCYFFPFDRQDDWGAELHTLVPMPEVAEWKEGQWHPHDMLLAPMRGAGGRLLGHISVDEPRTGMRPSQRTLEILAVFANQAAIAVENANLYADARRRAENLALINEVGQTLTHLVEPEQVLETVVEAVGLLLKCDMGAVFQPDPDDGEWAAVASYGADLTAWASLRSPPGEGLVGQVAAMGTPLVLPDTEQEPRFVQGPVPVGSMILVPIVVGQQVTGVLAAGSARRQALTEADEVLLATLADQAAVALESTRFFTTTQQAALRLASLNEIGRRIAGKLELQEMLETTVNSLHEYLDYVRVGVFLVDEATSDLYVAAANEAFRGLLPPHYRQKVGEGLIGAAAASGETVLVNDAYADGRYIQVGEWGSPSGVSVPIRIGETVIGVLEVEADRRGAFTEEDAAALEIAADQLAVAIENAHLFQEAQRRVAELATINEIGRAISSALDTEQLAQLIYGQVRHLLDIRSFQIALFDPDAELIRVEFCVERGQRQPPFVLGPGQGLTSHLLRTGQPILLAHGVEEFLQEHELAPEGDAARSWLGVPMIAEDRVIGGIAVQSFERDNAFDAGHLALLTTIAGQAAVAYQNASLFEERQQRIEQLNVLNEVAQATSSTLELDELLEVVYHQASRIVDTSNFFIALYDEKKDGITFPFVVDPEQREDWHPQAKGEGLTGIIIDTGKPLLLPTGAAGLYRDSGREVHAGLCCSWLGVPMIAEDRVLGVIAVQDYEREHVYSEEHVNLLSTVAAQAAVAVRNAQLYQQIVGFSSELEAKVEARTRDLENALDELTVERDRVEALYRITSELGATLELDRVLQRALELFARALRLEHGTILLVDQATGRLNLRATLQLDRQIPRGGKPTRWEPGVGLAGWVLEHREPVVIADIREDPRWVHDPGKELRIRSAVAAPLSLGGGDILGILTLGHPREGYFTEEHLQLITAATSQIAMAVNNSDLYAFITDQADQLGGALQAQQEEAAKNRAVLESIADGVLVLDHNGRVLLVNPAAEELLGFAGMALLGEHFRHMLGLGETPIHRELAQALYSELRARLESGWDTAPVQEGRVRLEAGEKTLAVNMAPLMVALGGAPGLVAALRDVSREAEVERLKNEFISTVSHELRTPMTSIKGYTDLLFLGMAGGLTDTQEDFLRIIKSNADRLTALVNDILDISRIETGRMRLTIEPLDLGELISQVVVSFREQYREKGLSLAWQEPEELPQIRGDAARVTQVLNNLLANAWHYTPEGGRVAVSVKPKDGFLQVDVADTGIGISPDDVGRVFDRFYRADHPVVQEAEGTGLGLSIVKMFVEMLGGEIWVKSKLQVGSLFSFTLPLSSTELPEPVPDLLSAELTAGISRRPKILVVEDDRDLALLLRRQLESEGYQVLLAGGGEDALWLAREAQPQLVTLDIMLPDMDGFTVLEQLKTNPLTSGIPVIIVSVLTETERGYSLGAVDYIVKPFEEEKLFDTVRNALLSVEDGISQRLVVAEDDPEVLAFLEESLTLHGYQVWTASNGQEALARVRECQPDLILLDTKMPGMDGYEVIRQLKSDEATSPIPIIVTTGSPVDKERDGVSVLGMDFSQYAAKPLSLEMLIRAIKQSIVGKTSQ